MVPVRRLLATRRVSKPAQSLVPKSSPIVIVPVNWLFERSMNWRLPRKPPHAGNFPSNILLDKSTLLSRAFTRPSGLDRNSVTAALEISGIGPLRKLSLSSNSCLVRREVNHEGIVPVKKLPPKSIISMVRAEVSSQTA